MTHKDNITAILECSFAGFKEEIIESACNRILEQEKSETVTEFADRCRECGAKYGKLLKKEPCEDAISRQAVLDGSLYTETEEGWSGMTVDVKYIEALPPVNPQPKTGHWIDTGSGQMCSRCGEIQHGYDSFRRFCASCGAKMIEPQESEDK